MSDEERLARRVCAQAEPATILLLDRNLAKEAWFDVPWVRLDQHGVAYPVDGDDGAEEAVTGHRAVALQARDGWRLSFQDAAMSELALACYAVVAHAHGPELGQDFVGVPTTETRLAIIVRSAAERTGPAEHVDAWILHPGTSLVRRGDGSTEIMGWPTAMPRPPGRYEPRLVGTARADDVLHVISASLVSVMVVPTRFP